MNLGIYKIKTLDKPSGGVLVFLARLLLCLENDIGDPFRDFFSNIIGNLCQPNKIHNWEIT